MKYSGRHPTFILLLRTIQSSFSIFWQRRAYFWAHLGNEIHCGSAHITSSHAANLNIKATFAHRCNSLNMNTGITFLVTSSFFSHENQSQVGLLFAHLPSQSYMQTCLFSVYFQQMIREREFMGNLRLKENYLLVEYFFQPILMQLAISTFVCCSPSEQNLNRLKKIFTF